MSKRKKKKRQPDQFDLYDALRARDAGASRSIERSGDDWKAAALRVVSELAELGRPFSCDDLHRAAVRAGIREPLSYNSWGAVMIAAAHLGIVVNTGRSVMSHRVSAHARRISLWVGATSSRYAATGS